MTDRWESNNVVAKEDSIEYFVLNKAQENVNYEVIEAKLAEQVLPFCWGLKPPRVILGGVHDC